MKNIKHSAFYILFLISTVLLFAACEKDETPETFDSISGVLSAGEGMTAEDLNGLEIYLGKFHNSANFDNITFKTTAIDSLAATTLNTDGSFSFNNLVPGNYGLAMKNGFIFSRDTALSINLNENNECIIQKEIDRLPEENFVTLSPPNPYIDSDHLVITDIDLKIINLSPTYQIKEVRCYFDSVLHTYAFDVPAIENTIFRHRVYDQGIPDNNEATPEYPFKTTEEIKFIICKYNNGTVADTIKTELIPVCDIYNNWTPSTTWSGNVFDISWFAYSSTESGFWPWNKTTTTILPHYEISVHK